MRARGARGASASTRRSAAAPARPRRRASARGLGAADGVGDAALGPQMIARGRSGLPVSTDGDSAPWMGAPHACELALKQQQALFRLDFAWGAAHFPTAPVKLIASDVDGTLLDSRHALRRSTAEAAAQLRAAGVELVLATGKARGPWVDDVVPELELEGKPGVFLQGLYVTSDCRRGCGEVLYSCQLPAGVVAAAADTAARLGLTLTLYSAERIVCKETDAQTDRLLPYREPTPEAVGDLGAFVEAGNAAHKVIFMGEDEEVRAARAEIEAELCAGFGCDSTTALPGMLEIVPMGASKASGLRVVLEHVYGGAIAPEEIMGVGDSENDMALLAMCGTRCAMGNASDALKERAHYVLGSNDDALGWPAAANLALQSQAWLAGV